MSIKYSTLGDLRERYVIVNNTPTKVSSVYVGNGDSTATKIRPVGRKPGSNTLAYIPFNGNGTDESNNHNNATVSNANWLTENGRKYLQGTYSTNLTGCYATLPKITISNECTYQARIKMNTNTSIYTVYMGCYYEGSANLSLSSLTINSSKYRANFSKGNNLISLTSEMNIITGWHLQTVTLKSGQQKFYLDGVLKATTSQNSVNFVITSNTPFTLNRMTNSNRTASCAIGDFILENKVRTDQEVSEYYNLTKGNYGL